MKILLVFSLFWSFVYCSYWGNILLVNNDGYKYTFNTEAGTITEQNANATNKIQGDFGYTIGIEQIPVESSVDDENSTSNDSGQNSTTNTGIIGIVGIDGNLGTANILIRESTPVNTLIRESASSNASQDSLGSIVPAEVENTQSSESNENSTQPESQDGSGNTGNELGESDSSDNTRNGTGSESGVTGESLGTSNGSSNVEEQSNSETTSTSNENESPSVKEGSSTSNGSYSFSYSNQDSSRSESSDSEGNVKGQYSYVNNVGIHDLSYEAGPEKGFLPTGGSLSVPNGLPNSAVSNVQSSTNQGQVPVETDQKRESNEYPKVLIPIYGLNGIQFVPVNRPQHVDYILH